jgi:hypothetical protein
MESAPPSIAAWVCLSAISCAASAQRWAADCAAAICFAD